MADQAVSQMTNLPAASVLSSDLIYVARGPAGSGTDFGMLWSQVLVGVSAGLSLANSASIVGTSAATASTLALRDANGNSAFGVLTASQIVGLSTPLTVGQGGTGTSTFSATSAATASTLMSRDASGNTSVAQLNATKILGLTTPLSPAQGGSGTSSLTANGILMGNGTGNFQVAAVGTAGQPFVSGGTLPGSYGAIPSSNVTGLANSATIAGTSANTASSLMMRDSHGNSALNGLAIGSILNFFGGTQAVSSIVNGTNVSAVVTNGSLSLSASGGGGGSPGGSTTQVQYNNSGAFAGNSGLTFNQSSGLLTAGAFAGNGAAITDITASASLPIDTPSDPAAIVINASDVPIFQTDASGNPVFVDASNNPLINVLAANHLGIGSSPVTNATGAPVDIGTGNGSGGGGAVNIGCSGTSPGSTVNIGCTANSNGATVNIGVAGTNGGTVNIASGGGAGGAVDVGGTPQYPAIDIGAGYGPFANGTSTTAGTIQLNFKPTTNSTAFFLTVDLSGNVQVQTVGISTSVLGVGVFTNGLLTG